MALIKCPECEKEISDKATSCPNCGCPLQGRAINIVAKVNEKGYWSAGRLAIGIISIVLFFFIMLQSCAAGLNNAIEENGSDSGSRGFWLAVFMLISGIVGVCTRNSKARTGAIVTTVLYWLAALMAVGEVKTYPDLAVWGIVSFAFGVVFLVSAIKTKIDK